MDRARIGTFTSGGRFTSTYDLNDGSNSAFLRDTFDVHAHEETTVWAKTNRRYGGSKKAAEMHDNGSIDMEFYLGNGSTLVQAMQRFDALVAVTEDAATQYFFEWRPDGATRSVYYELRGLGPWDPMYRWIEVQSSKRLHVKLSLQVAPVALGDPMDVYDDFSVDTFTAGDYTADAGAFANTPIVGGVVTAAANLTTENRFTHTARGYSHPDGQYAIKVIPGTTLTSFKAGRYFKTASTTYLEVYVTDNGTTSSLVIRKVVAGTPTIVASTNLGTRIATGTQFWVRGRIEGNVVFAEHWATEPTGPTNLNTPTTSTSYTLTAAEAALFGTGIAGTAGLVFTPQSANATLDDYRDEPYTYGNKAFPWEFDLFSIPGTAPAQANVHVTMQPNVSIPFAMFGWTTRPAIHNMFQNGDAGETATGFGPVTAPWVVTAVAAFNAAATSVAINSTQAKYGTKSIDVTTILGNANSGAAAQIFRLFKRGQLYTAKMWVRSSTSVANVQIKFGNSGANDTALGTSTPLSTTWQELTVTWTPSADRLDAHVAILRPTSGAADVFQIDAVRVFEGSVESTSFSQSEGRGAFPPFGIIEFENDTGVPAAFPVTADAAARSGFTRKATQSWSAGGNTTIASVWVDPSLLVADDFTTEINVEVWARINNDPLMNPLVLTPYIFPEGGSTATATFTNEWGQAGNTITLQGPTTATYNFVRVGTITFPIERERPTRFLVQFRVAATAVVASALAGVDYLVMAPSRGRSASPTGKDPSGSFATYPVFISKLTGDVRRIIRTDLSALRQDLTSGIFRSHGLGGSPIEFPPGNVQAFIKTSTQIPNQTATATVPDDRLNTDTGTVHFAITPRYHLARSS